MRTTLVLAALIGATGVQAQEQQQAQQIDPMALKVLKAVLDPIKDAGAYSFRARISEERLGTNGQIITRLRETTATVAQPDRLRVDLQRGGREVIFLFDRGNAVLYSPARELYTKIAAPPTIQAALVKLRERNIAFPTSNLLEPDPYKSVSDGLTGAYVIGETSLEGVPVTHLAFTEPGASWQLWAEGGATPRPRRLEIVYLDRPGQPRVTVTFEDWKLGGNINPALFSFTPPPGAHEIQLLTLRRQGGPQGD